MGAIDDMHMGDSWVELFKAPCERLIVIKTDFQNRKVEVFPNCRNGCTWKRSDWLQGYLSSYPGRLAGRIEMPAFLARERDLR